MLLILQKKKSLISIRDVFKKKKVLCYVFLLCVFRRRSVWAALMERLKGFVILCVHQRKLCLSNWSAAGLTRDSHPYIIHPTPLKDATL